MKWHQHHSQNSWWIKTAIVLSLIDFKHYIMYIYLLYSNDQLFQIVCFYIFSRPRNHRCPPHWVVTPACLSLSSPWSLSTPSWSTAHRPWTGCCPSWPPRCGEYSHFMKQFTSIFILSCLKLMLILNFSKFKCHNGADSPNLFSFLLPLLPPIAYQFQTLTQFGGQFNELENCQNWIS